MSKKMAMEIWDKFAVAIKEQDKIRLNNHKLEAELMTEKKREREQSRMIKNMEDVMRCLAAGYEFYELLKNMGIGEDFLPKDY